MPGKRIRGATRPQQKEKARLLDGEAVAVARASSEPGVQYPTAQRESKVIGCWSDERERQRDADADADGGNNVHAGRADLEARQACRRVDRPHAFTCTTATGSRVRVRDKYMHGSACYLNSVVTKFLDLPFWRAGRDYHPRPETAVLLDPATA